MLDDFRVGCYISLSVARKFLWGFEWWQGFSSAVWPRTDLPQSSHFPPRAQVQHLDTQVETSWFTIRLPLASTSHHTCTTYAASTHIQSYWALYACNQAFKINPFTLLFRVWTLSEKNSPNCGAASLDLTLEYPFPSKNTALIGSSSIQKHSLPVDTCVQKIHQRVTLLLLSSGLNHGAWGGHRESSAPFPLAWPSALLALAVQYIGLAHWCNRFAQPFQERVEFYVRWKPSWN